MTVSDDNSARNLQDFAALEPFFRIIQEGLTGLVEAEHFFDLLAEDVVVEYVVCVPGCPSRIEGRRAVADLYRGYGDAMLLSGADELAVHHDTDRSTVVLARLPRSRAIFRALGWPPETS